jgi:phosphoribosylformimino-5-aminoimidazole carboxamide ribotide isomerase
MIEIIPAIDIIDGKCVRLTQGDYAQKKIYNENPLEVAKAFEDSGIKRLHLVDLDGAKQKTIVNHAVLASIAQNTNLQIDFGGGLQDKDSAAKAFDYGANQITGGSIAIKNPEVFLDWLETFGPEKIILGADAKNENIAISGWQEETQVHILDFLQKFISKGIKYTISTDVAKDGLLEGPSFDLYEKLQTNFQHLKIIASGGISQMADIEKLNQAGIYGVIVGKAFYENKISLDQINAFYAQ